MSGTLIDARTLAMHAGDPRWICFDCRHSLADAEYGSAAYAGGHIPGARFADLDRDLAAPPGVRGRHPLPDRDQLVARFRAWGATTDSQLIAYDDAGGMFACRFWWLARWLGHAAVAVLDGGLAAWLEYGGALTSKVPEVQATNFAPRTPLTRTVDADAIVRSRDPTLIDARASERYAGEEEPIDPVAGHIPGALSLPCSENLDERGRFRRDGDRFAALAEADVVSYCGSGVTATHNILAMLLAGHEEPALYPGSWSEWLQEPSRGVEVGNGTASAP
ncbi:MAG: sulfurtransferase [Gammaproteobacteria bacterium]|nr:sulfurtransferase [Gammaproteobacteria bacterium]